MEVTAPIVISTSQELELSAKDQAFNQHMSLWVTLHTQTVPKR